MNDEWETPAWLFDALHGEFNFTVDGAASARNRKLARFWSKDINALSFSWERERVFLNPPYSRGQLARWLSKVERETRTLRIEPASLVVALLPADTSTDWFHRYVARADEVRLLDRRVKFVGAPGSPKFGSIVAIWQGGLSLAPATRIVPWSLNGKVPRD